MVPDAASQVTAAWRKYDSLAMWQASAALWPKTASSTTGLRDAHALEKCPEVRAKVVPGIALVGVAFGERFLAGFGVVLGVPLLEVGFAHRVRGSWRCSSRAIRLCRIAA